MQLHFSFLGHEKKKRRNRNTGPVITGILNQGWEAPACRLLVTGGKNEHFFLSNLTKLGFFAKYAVENIPR